jgi:hypothetical protein
MFSLQWVAPPIPSSSARLKASLLGWERRFRSALNPPIRPRPPAAAVVVQSPFRSAAQMVHHSVESRPPHVTSAPPALERASFARREARAIRREESPPGLGSVIASESKTGSAMRAAATPVSVERLPHGPSIWDTARIPTWSRPSRSGSRPPEPAGSPRSVRPTGGWYQIVPGGVLTLEHPQSKPTSPHSFHR